MSARCQSNIPAESVEILEKIGAWMQKNSDSIYGCGGCDLPKPENGRITRNGKTLYYHIMEKLHRRYPAAGWAFRSMRLESIRLISDGTEIKPLKNWIVENYRTSCSCRFPTL